ncbi:MAG: FixH family protein [Winogradskyella sp.]
MKWNWGKGIVVAIIAFMGFILYLVITMTTDKNFSHDLVTEDYYAKEMAYQNEINAETNTNNLKEKIISKKVATGWLISFPKELNYQDIKGTLFLYRPSNQKLDFETKINLSSNDLLLPNTNLIDGRWNIIIDFTYHGKSYMYKEEIMY